MPLGGASFDESSVPPWTRGDLRGVLGAVTHTLGWVVESGTNHPGAPRPLSLGATPPMERIFMGAATPLRARCDVRKKTQTDSPLGRGP